MNENAQHFALLVLNNLDLFYYPNRAVMMTASKAFQEAKVPHRAFQYYPEAKMWTELMSLSS